MSETPDHTVAEQPLTPRKTPCASCPYRKNVPSGIWAPEEYDKLPRYDEPTYAQPTAVFQCHQGDREVCSGWLGHGDPTQLLAVRIGVSAGEVDPSCFDYQTDVELFSSGQEAAQHGVRELYAPSAEASAAITKIVRVREHSALGPVETRPRPE